MSVDLRIAAYVAATLAGLAALAFVAVGLNDVRVAAALRGRGVIAQAQRIGERCSESRNGRGFTTRSCVGLWSFRSTTGDRLTMDDLGAAINTGDEAGPGWGPPREGQIAYLPDQPRTARLRSQVEPDLTPMLGGGGLFLLLAGLFGAAGHWLLDPARRTAKDQPVSPAVAQRRERRGLLLSRAMLIGIPLAVIAGLFLI